LLPIFWAYPEQHAFTDQLWSSLFVLLEILSFLGAKIVQATIPGDAKTVSVQTPAPSEAHARS
jgi:hypothetical protein